MPLSPAGRWPALLLVLLSLGAGTLPAAAQEALRVVGTPRLLVGGDTPFARPVWSPDGRRLALTTPGYAGLWTVRADGAELAQVSDEAGAGFGFSWSTSGAALLARVARFEGPRRLDAVKVFDLQAGEARLLTPFRTDLNTLPHWSPADEAVYLYADGRLEVLASGEPAARAPKAGPDAPLFFAREAGIGRATLADDAVTVLPPFREDRVLNLTPSPDGSRLAFHVAGGNLFVMQADGTGVVDLGPGHRPQWSPDGRWIVYVRAEDDGYQITGADLYAARADGAAHVQLTRSPDRHEVHASWSPDGRAIAFDDLQTGALYVMEVAQE